MPSLNSKKIKLSRTAIIIISQNRPQMLARQCQSPSSTSSAFLFPFFFSLSLTLSNKSPREFYGLRMNCDVSVFAGKERRRIWHRIVFRRSATDSDAGGRRGRSGLVGFRHVPAIETPAARIRRRRAGGRSAQSLADRTRTFSRTRSPSSDKTEPGRVMWPGRVGLNRTGPCAFACRGRLDPTR